MWGLSGACFGLWGPIDHGLNLSGTSGQSEKAVKTLSVPLTDSTTEFWMRVDSASGIAVAAEGRDEANTEYEWVLKYDSAQQQLRFYPTAARRAPRSSQAWGVRR